MNLLNRARNPRADSFCGRLAVALFVCLVSLNDANFGTTLATPRTLENSNEVRGRRFLFFMKISACLEDIRAECFGVIGSLEVKVTSNIIESFDGVCGSENLCVSLSARIVWGENLLRQVEGAEG